MSSATMKCEYCGSPAHVWWSCGKKPVGWKPDRLKKSTAARKDVQGKTKARNALARIGTTPPVKAAQPPVSEEAAFASTGDSIRELVPEVNSPAGTQAPPVDKLQIATAAQADVIKRGVGRPRLHADRKAYKAQKERERRAKAKAKS